MRYFRNQSGSIVHREGCRHQPPFPRWWTWAEGKTVPQIMDESKQVGVKLKLCWDCLSPSRRDRGRAS